MKLTKRILVVALMLALLVSAFAFTSSAEFTEDDIDDILEYYYPKYVKEDFNAPKYAEDDKNEENPLYCLPLDSSVSVELKTEKAKITKDPENEKNSYLSYYYVTDDNDPKYFGYNFSLEEGVPELIFTMKVCVERGLAQALPTYSIILSAYDAEGNPVGEASLVTPVSLNFETGEVKYAKVNPADPSSYTNVPVDDMDFYIEGDTWYTVTIIVNCNEGKYDFSVESESGELYEAFDISLGNANCIEEINAAFVTYPKTSGSTSLIDDIEFFRGTFFRGDEDIDEITVETLSGIATLLEGDLELETKLKIIEVYKAIFNSGYVPGFSNKYTEAEVKALYESAKEFIPAAYTEFFCEEATTVDSGKSYARRQDKLIELAAYFPMMNGESFYLGNIDAAITVLEDTVFADFDAAIAEHNLKYTGNLTEDEIAALDEELKEITDARASAEKAFNDYKVSLAKKEKSDTRVSALNDTLTAAIGDFEASSECLSETIEVVEKNEALLAKLRTALDAYNAEIKSLDEVKKDSENFITYMRTFNAESRDYTYLLDAHKQILEYKLRDNSYNYSYNNPDCVYYYIPTLEALEKKIEEMNAVIGQFKDSVLIMQEPDADFNRKFNVGYLSAKEVYNDGKIYEGIDVATVPGLANDIAKYLEIEASFSVTINASENFIASVNAAMFNTLYETKKAALAAAKALLETDVNINKAYPGVAEAEAQIATVEADIKALEDAAAAYIAAVAEIGTKTNFNAKKAAVEAALALQASGNVTGVAGVAEANGALANYSAEIQILEGNCKTFIDSVAMLDNENLTLAERRALIIIADGVKAGAETTYDGVEEALAKLANAKEEYKARVEAINAAFSGEISKVSSVAGASVNQSRYYSVIELIKLIVASFK